MLPLLRACNPDIFIIASGKSYSVEYFAKTKKTLAKFKGINDVVREDGEVRIKYDKKNKMPIVIDK